MVVNDVCSYDLLREAIKARITAKDLSPHLAAGQIGVPYIVLSHVIDGTEKPSLNTYVRCCMWLGDSLYKYLIID